MSHTELILCDFQCFECDDCAFVWTELEGQTDSGFNCVLITD